MGQTEGAEISHVGGASCACDEGFITVYTPDGKKIQRYDRTGLAAHDCAYVKWRNSKIPEAEAICRRRGFAPEGLPFLQVMDGLCRPKDSNAAYDLPRDFDVIRALGVSQGQWVVAR